MRVLYSDYIDLLDDPEDGLIFKLLRYELARKLAAVIGLPYRTIHQALLAVNPHLYLTDTGVIIEPGRLGVIEEKTGELLIAEALSPRRFDEISDI